MRSGVGVRGGAFFACGGEILSTGDMSGLAFGGGGVCERGPVGKGKSLGLTMGRKDSTRLRMTGDTRLRMDKDNSALSKGLCGFGNYGGMIVRKGRCSNKLGTKDSVDGVATSSVAMAGSTVGMGTSSAATPGKAVCCRSSGRGMMGISDANIMATMKTKATGMAKCVIIKKHGFPAGAIAFAIGTNRLNGLPRKVRLATTSGGRGVGMGSAVRCATSLG